MNIEEITQICISLPKVTQDIKWGHDLCFCIGDKMFCVVGLDEIPTSASFKVTEEQFEELIALPYFKPAPYVARYKWVFIEDISKMNRSDWENFIQQSYELVKAKLPNKIKKQLE